MDCAGPSRKGIRGRRYVTPGPATFNGAPSIKNINYIKMHHLKKFKHFLPRKNPENVSPGPAAALDGPGIV